MERQNYYLLLGLEFDPPQTDEEAIRRAIRQYISAATDADRDERYLRAADMNSLLLDQNRAAERQQEAEGAAAIVYAALDRVIREAACMSNPPALSSAWTDRIAAAAGFPASVVERRMKRSAKLIVPAAEAPKRFDQEMMNSINGALDAVQVDTLNEYLLRYMPDGTCKPGSVWKQPKTVIYAAVNAALRRSRSPEEKSMAVILLAFFNNSSLLRDYEAELEMAPVFRLADEMNSLDQAGLLARSPQEAARVYEQLMRHTADDQEAMKLYKALFFQPLAMPLPDKRRVERDATVCCEVCGTIQRISRQSKMLCRTCQAPLSCKCEKCGQWFAAMQQDRACPHCGYSRSRSRQVKELMRLSAAARRNGLKGQADKYRSEAFLLDADMAAALAEEKNAQIRSQIELLQEEHRFYALRELLDRETEIDGWNDLRRQAEEAIDCAESLLGRMDGLEEEQLYLLLRAVTHLCSDIPDFETRIGSYIPPAPDQVAYSQKDGITAVKWEYPNRPEARFSVACRVEPGDGEDTWYEVAADDLACTEYSFKENMTAGYYMVRAELFGAASAWTPIGWLGGQQACYDLRTRLTAQGMEITWRSRLENAKLVLIKKVNGTEKERIRLQAGVRSYLDAGFDRNETAEYCLALEHQRHGGSVVSAGLKEIDVRRGQAGLGAPDRCIYRYEPDESVSVAWHTGDKEEQPLTPGVYAEEELTGIGLKACMNEASGIMECHPLPGGGGFIQPVWRGGGCLRVGPAIYPMPNVEPFRDVSCTCRQKGLYHIEAQWPAKADGAVITACAARYAEPGALCGEITLRVPAREGQRLEADIPWTLTPYVCIAVRAYRKVREIDYLSEAYRIPVNTVSVVWNISSRAGKRRLHVEFEAAKHTVYRPALDAVSSGTGRRFQAAEAGVLYAGRPWKIICELPDGTNWDQVVWNGEDHDLFRLVNGKDAHEK